MKYGWLKIIITKSSIAKSWLTKSGSALLVLILFSLKDNTSGLVMNKGQPYRGPVFLESIGKSDKYKNVFGEIKEIMGWWSLAGVASTYGAEVVMDIVSESILELLSYQPALQIPETRNTWQLF